MPIRYKLTNGNGETFGQTSWGPGASYTTSGEGNLCGPGWLHCYSDPLLAVLFNPMHAAFPHPRLCEVEVDGQCREDRGLKEGWTAMVFVRWLDIPTVTPAQRVAFAIRCAKEVYSELSWVQWADNWLSGADRSIDAANAAASAAANAAADAASAAYAAADAANAAADAASAAYAAYAADAAADAANAAADAAYAANAAADAAYAANAAARIDFAALAQRALELVPA